MYFAVFCLILVSSTQAGPLPRLRYRPPKWVKLEPIKLLKSSKEAFHIETSRKFVPILRFDDPLGKETNSIFGDRDYIHLTKGRNKKHNNLLNIVEQLVAEDGGYKSIKDQDDRGVMQVVTGLKRGLRRQGGLPPKLVYDFNELVS